MSAFDKYDTAPPKVRVDSIVDNPLLPKSGIPLADDDFVDSTERIINATNTNDVRFDDENNVWQVDPGKFYGDSGLSGIDSAPDSKRVFDLGKFNKVFERNKEVVKESQRINDLNKLNALSETQERTSLYNLSIFQIIVNTKDAWFNLLDDLLDQRFELSTFTKDDRMFYIGVTIVTIAVVLYLYGMMTSTEDTTEKPVESVQKIYHIYQHPDYAGMNGQMGGQNFGQTVGQIVGQQGTNGQNLRLSNISEFSTQPTRPIVGKKK
ncbi:hypothetical protein YASMINEVIRUS_431 [Yasminevirus sp. GU-2018]|uniref:Uncharacterized protein n=1 Tax=Yasminevirus sp. GU-2018 TaxID=2420051 RepID=A0A5K0U7M1_9VIRU|nr:hypothetical protein YASMINEVIRUS_431 [Yasminevirus sp. GU-2018]